MFSRFSLRWVPVLGFIACGHPATLDECRYIFDRSTELELSAQKVADPTLVQKRVEELRHAGGDDLIRQCVGKNITDSALKCVRGAQTLDELEKCLY